jgi:CRP-like cAMP-binding protein
MSFNPNYFIHAGNILLLVAYSVRDILWLRLFAVAAALISVPYFLLQPTRLWEPIIWTAIFAAINLIQSLRLFIERRPVKLSPEEEEVRRLALAALPPRKVLQVLSIGSWITAEIGERLIESGKRIEAVWLIIRGKVRVTSGAQVLGELGPGHLVGSALLLSGVPADIDASPSEPVRAVRWEPETLQKYLAANPDVRVVVQQFLARDLAGKLGRSFSSITAADHGVASPLDPA